jgi:hypothetical protein
MDGVAVGVWCAVSVHDLEGRDISA